MLLLLLEGAEKATQRDLAVAWSPHVFLDISIVEFLIRLVCWYSNTNTQWRGALMETQLATLLGTCILLSLWMWFSLDQRRGLGMEEAQIIITHKRVAGE
jgi:hypothetical protein